MAQPGWFPDPGGQPGMYRYWDGTAWTQQRSAKVVAERDPSQAAPWRHSTQALACVVRESSVADGVP
jgi:hypothetical protein